LTEARSVEGIASAVAGRLGVPLGREDPIEQLGHAFAGRGRCLVILDNFEQVVGQAEVTVGRWLSRAEEARFVVTSRERLNLRGEDVQVVEPLAVESGVELFIERARHQRPGFEVGGAELESVREMVRLVEGMPLALELAAARLRVMTPAQLVARMRERFRLLTGTESGRHATLAAAIEGSWALLRPWEKAALAQCSVFEGGFALEAAEAVLDLGAWPEAPWVVDVVQSLVDKSLLRTWVPEEPVGTVLPHVRFGMYVSLQEYAENKLKEENAVPGGTTGAQAVRSVEERHGVWFAGFGQDEAIDALGRHGGIERRRTLARELENLVAACRRAVGRKDHEIAVRTYRAAWAVLDLQGPYGTAVALGNQVLQALLEEKERAAALMTLGRAERHAGRMEDAHSHLEAALALYREIGNRRLEGIVLSDLGTLHHEQGRTEEARNCLEAALVLHREAGDQDCEGVDLGTLATLELEQGRMEQAHTQFEAALAIYRKLGHRRNEGIALINLGILHFYQGRMDEARAHYEAALSIHRQMRDRPSEGIVLGPLGGLHLIQGRVDQARTHYEAALAIHREVGRRRFEGVALGQLGVVLYEQGRTEEARAHFEAALAIHREVGHRRFEGVVLGDLGNLHLEQGRIQEARTLYEAALVIDREVGNRRSEGVALGNFARLHLEEGRMEDAHRALARGEELIREVGDRFGLGKLLCVRAELERRNGDIAAAGATLAEAEALAVQISSGPTSDLGRRLAKLRQALDIRPSP
jgi:predicted ATPase